MKNLGRYRCAYSQFHLFSAQCVHKQSRFSNRKFQMIFRKKHFPCRALNPLQQETAMQGRPQDCVPHTSAWLPLGVLCEPPCRTRTLHSHSQLSILITQKKPNKLQLMSREGPWSTLNTGWQWQALPKLKRKVYKCFAVWYLTYCSWSVKYLFGRGLMLYSWYLCFAKYLLCTVCPNLVQLQCWFRQIFCNSVLSMCVHTCIYRYTLHILRLRVWS